MKDLKIRLEQLERAKSRSRVFFVRAAPSDNPKGVRYSIDGKEVNLEAFQEDDIVFIDDLALENGLIE